MNSLILIKQFFLVGSKKPGFWEIEDFLRIFWRKNPVSGYLLAAF
ncbi:hypothetical protein [Microcoleus sp. PH2017_02_FOX_O_A]|nr:hypothetical protein [Microcoleus sp. PH2017_02_FOX_O_A]